MKAHVQVTTKEFMQSIKIYNCLGFIFTFSETSSNGFMNNRQYNYMLRATSILNTRTLFLGLQLMSWPVSPIIYCSYI
jgi:hypothetical protein